MLFVRRVSSLCAGLAGLLVIAGLSGCIDAAQSASEPATAGTVSGVGGLPEFADTAPATTDTVEVVSSETVPVTEPELSFGEKAKGNRLLMIGDSLTASISQRYGGEACTSLVPLGWQVEVDAETGRFIDFGKLVLDRRLNAGWDAAVMFLGNNYGDNKDTYQRFLHDQLLRLAPRPTVLLTTTMFRDKQADVNAVIMDEASKFPNVSVIDWATISEDPAFTGDDGLHLTEAGRQRLGAALAETIGQAAVTPGKCLATSFKDDSAGSPYGPGGKKNGTKTTTKPSSGSTTTTKSTGTTQKPKPTESTVGPDPTSGGPPHSTAPPATSGGPSNSGPPATGG